MIEFGLKIVKWLKNLPEQDKVHRFFRHIIKLNEECVHRWVQMFHIRRLHVESCVYFGIREIAIDQIPEMEICDLQKQNNSG